MFLEQERLFDMEDQILFAKLSGDYNPLHINPIVARRLLFGRPVVHGVHTLLWALDVWLLDKKRSIELRTISVVFNLPVAVGQAVNIVIVQDDVENVKIILMVGKTKAVQIEATFIQVPVENIQYELPPSHSFDQTECRMLEKDDMEFAAGKTSLFLDRQLAKCLFPNLLGQFSWLQLSQILATTRIVGMLCPGFHSIYSGMELAFYDQVSIDAYEMVYHVLNFDSRFAMTSIAVEASGMKGSLKAFFRPPPKRQRSYQDIARVVNHNEFGEQYAIIIGGSRGLGEVAAKLLAAGGADVCISYYHGSEEADSVVAEIVSGGGKAYKIPFNVLEPPENLGMLFRENWNPTHLYYFATPFIAVGSRGVFSYQLFENFCNYYIKGFYDTINAINSAGTGLKKIFYPSTVFVDELPLNMAEYSISKAAGEMLCRFLQKSLAKGNVVYHDRLQRLATDQTASLLPIESNDPVPVILSILRSIALC